MVSSRSSKRSALASKSLGFIVVARVFLLSSTIGLRVMTVEVVFAVRKNNIVGILKNFKICPEGKKGDLCVDGPRAFAANI